MTATFASIGTLDLAGVKRLYVSDLVLRWACPECGREREEEVSYEGAIQLGVYAGNGTTTVDLDCEDCNPSRPGSSCNPVAVAEIRLTGQVVGRVLDVRPAGPPPPQCPFCDRVGCPALTVVEGELQAINASACDGTPVNWRERAIAAEEHLMRVGMGRT